MKISRVLAAAVLATTATATPIKARDNPDYPDPTIDPFYTTPANVSKYSPGQIIRQRLVPTIIDANLAKAYQILFRTNDNQEQATSTVATVWVPLVPASPPKIFSYQVAEDAVTLDCAPSWGWIVNSASNENGPVRTIEGPIVVPWAMAQGYYVVNPDAEGPNSAFIVGKVEGQSGLDGVRATMNLAGLSAGNTDVALFGFSGAAHTSVWMATLAAQYAPELRLVGAAFGGTPLDLKSNYDLVNVGSQSAVAGGALIGLANGYAGPNAQPDLNATVYRLLTPQGRQYAALFKSNNFCFPNEHIGDQDYNDIFEGGDFINNPDVVTVLGKESLLSNVSTILPVPVPKFPRLQYHGTNDSTVPYWPEAAYVQQQCQNGANIQFVTFPGLDHQETYVAGFVGALGFIKSSFDGVTPKVTCGFPTSTPLPLPGSAAAVAILGKVLSDLLTKSVGGVL